MTAAPTRSEAPGSAAVRKAVVLRFFTALAEGGSVGDLVTADYVPRIPKLAGLPRLTPGRDALAARIHEAGALPHRVYRVIVDGNLACAQLHYNGDAPCAGMDIFRFDAADHIAEHWNVRQVIAASAPADDRFGGSGDPDMPITTTRRGELRAGARRVLELWRHADTAQLAASYDPGYIQHNPDMPGGVQHIHKVFETEIKTYIAATGRPFPIACHHLGAAGDLIFLHYSVAMVGIGRRAGARSTNADIFRVDAAGRMAEHWDVLQIEGDTVPPTRLLF